MVSIKSNIKKTKNKIYTSNNNNNIINKIKPKIKIPENITNIYNPYLKYTIPLANKNDEKKQNLSSTQYVSIQNEIESYVINDDIQQIINIIDIIGIYYLDHDVCIIAAKHKSFKCMKWFVDNKIFIDKFVSEAAAQVNDLEMLKYVIPNLNCKFDVWTYIYAVINESIECLEYIMKNYYSDNNKIFQEGIKKDKPKSLSVLLNYGFEFSRENILLVCECGSIQTLMLLKNLNMSFSQKMAEISKFNGHLQCHDFIISNIFIVDN